MNPPTTTKYTSTFFRDYANYLKRKFLFNNSQITWLNGSLAFLLILLLHVSSPAQSTSLYDINLEIKEIKTIENLNERAAAWLVYAYKVTMLNAQDIEAKLKIDPALLSDTYPYNAAIHALTEAEISKVQGAHNKATINAYNAIQILESKGAKTISEKKILALAYVAFARFSKYARNKNGLNYGYKSLQLATDINYPIAKVFAHNQIGLHISYFKKDHTLALEHFEKAKELLPLLSKPVYDFTNGFILGNIAKTWSELGEIEKSINYKLELLADNRNSRNIELLLGTHNNLGTNYYDLKKYDLAEKYLQKTLDLMDKHQIYTNRGIPLYRMGLIQLEKGNLTKANIYVDAIDFWLIDHRFLGEYQVSFYQLKSKLAKANLDYEQAIFWLEKADKEQEAIIKLIGENNLVKLEEENKISEIKKESVLLENEQATIDTQRALLKIGGIIVLLGIIFCLFYFRLKAIYKSIVSNGRRDLLIEEKINKNPVDKQIDEVLKQKINKALKEKKLYLSSDLTLRKFASYLDSNTSYVSKTINEGFGKNYNALINEFRIEEVIQSFQSGEHKIYTIESIYKKAGFKSKSSFQKAFKTKLGVTASYYIECLKEIA